MTTDLTHSYPLLTRTPPSPSPSPSPSLPARYKTDMFFHFISEKVLPRKWDETHLQDRVELPRQVLTNFSF